MKLIQNFVEKRLVIIGDVHGCLDELKSLVNKFIKKDDVVILVGDIINKGPHSLETLKYVMEKKFLVVKGNHESSIIDTVKSRRKYFQSLNVFQRLRNWFVRDIIGRDLNVEGIPYNRLHREYDWTDKITDIQLNMLINLPYWISIPYHNALVVHAGLVPNIKLEEQETKHLITMRNLSYDTDNDTYRAFSGITDGKPWITFWEGPQHVFFGHDARRGLQKTPHATGLDTGCLYGKALTGIIIHPNKTREIISVPSKKVYVVPGT